MKLLNSFSRRTLLILALTGTLLCMTVIILKIYTKYNLPPVAIKHNSYNEIAYGLPVRLRIPSIGVDAVLEPVGLTPQGALDAPKGPTNAGWYNRGPRPGENGTSVIDGHYGLWKNGTPTVFNDLNKLQKGAKIYVIDENGAYSTFIVSGFGTYDKNLDATSIFNTVDRNAHLNLITCNGVWNNFDKSYDKRLVVFSDKEIKANQ